MWLKTAVFALLYNGKIALLLPKGSFYAGIFLHKIPSCKFRAEKQVHLL